MGSILSQMLFGGLEIHGNLRKIHGFGHEENFAPDKM